MHSICFDFLTLIDIKEMWLPSVVTYPLFWGGLLCPDFCSDPLFRIYGAFFLLCSNVLFYAACGVSEK